MPGPIPRLLFRPESGVEQLQLFSLKYPNTVVLSTPCPELFGFKLLDPSLPLPLLRRSLFALLAPRVPYLLRSAPPSKFCLDAESDGLRPLFESLPPTTPTDDPPARVGWESPVEGLGPVVS